MEGHRVPDRHRVQFREDLSQVFGRSQAGIDFGAADGPARIVFLIAAPDDGQGEHLTVLAALARRLVHESFREALISAGDAEGVVELIRNEVENR